MSGTGAVSELDMAVVLKTVYGGSVAKTDPLVQAVFTRRGF